jgi:hypothetical protein
MERKRTIAWALLKTAVFTLVVPGTVGVLIPRWLLSGAAPVVIGFGCPQRALPGPPAYRTSIVVTLSAGNVIVNDEPLTAIVPADTGCTGVPAVACAWAEAAVI